MNQSVHLEKIKAVNKNYDSKNKTREFALLNAISLSLSI